MLPASAENQQRLWPPQGTAVDCEGSSPGSEERGQGDPHPSLPTTKGLPRKEDFQCQHQESPQAYREELTSGPQGPGLGAGLSSSHTSPQSSQHREADSLLPIWQMRKPRLGEVQQRAQDNTARKWPSEDLNPRCLLCRCPFAWSPEEAPLVENGSRVLRQPHPGPQARAWVRNPLLSWNRPHSCQ